MANEITYSRIRHLLPDIWESVLDYLQYNTFMPGLVKTFSDMSGFQPRDVSEYIEGTLQDNLGELEDLVPNLYDRRLLSQIRPKEVGAQYLITDRRTESDDANIVADAARSLGYMMSKKMETDLMAQFPNLTGGLVNKANASLLWSDIYAARTALAMAAVPAPYTVVLHELQWHDLATAANIAGSSLQPLLTVRDDIQSQYYKKSLNDMNFFVSGLVPVNGSDDATGAMFNAEAIAFDLRRAPRIEPFRDPSLRAGELNLTSVYGVAAWRPSWGIQIVSDATGLVTSVTTASGLQISGTVDDPTFATGGTATFTFTVTNAGTVTSTGILVTFTVDSDFVYSSDSESMGAFSSSAKTWSGFDLAPGQTAVIILKYVCNGDGNMVGTVTSATPTVTGTPVATVAIDVS